MGVILLSLVAISEHDNLVKFRPGTTPDIERWAICVLGCFLILTGGHRDIMNFQN